MFASMLSSMPSPARWNSIRRLNSSTPRASSIRRANDSRTIVNSTPSTVFDGNATVLSYSIGVLLLRGSSERDRNFIIGNPLCAAAFEYPLLTHLGVVEFGRSESDSLQIDSGQLPRLLS